MAKESILPPAVLVPGAAFSVPRKDYGLIALVLSACGLGRLFGGDE